MTSLSNVGGVGFIPCLAAKIPHLKAKKKKKRQTEQKKYCNKFNKDLKKEDGSLIF